jgi:hypothetical protein
MALNDECIPARRRVERHFVMKRAIQRGGSPLHSLGIVWSAIVVSVTTAWPNAAGAEAAQTRNPKMKPSPAFLTLKHCLILNWKFVSRVTIRAACSQITSANLYQCSKNILARTAEFGSSGRNILH